MGEVESPVAAFELQFEAPGMPFRDYDLTHRRVQAHIRLDFPSQRIDEGPPGQTISTGQTWPAMSAVASAEFRFAAMCSDNRATVVPLITCRARIVLRGAAFGPPATIMLLGAAFGSPAMAARHVSFRHVVSIGHTQRHFF